MEFYMANISHWIDNQLIAQQDFKGRTVSNTPSDFNIHTYVHPHRINITLRSIIQSFLITFAMSFFLSFRANQMIGSKFRIILSS